MFYVSSSVATRNGVFTTANEALLKTMSPKIARLQTANIIKIQFLPDQSWVEVNGPSLP